MVILRGLIAHTPKNPFHEAEALQAFSDGGLAFQEGRILALGSFAEVRARFPDASVQDCREGVLLPGLVDTHVHYPQTRVIGAMGYTLLDWLQKRTLPLEARLSDNKLARELAREFVQLLLRNGTTTALVFGSHFQGATANLFGAAEDVGLRIIAGQVCSDRLLLPALHTTPERSYTEQKMLIQRFHRRGKLRYAVTPRFSLSASEGLLEVCQTLLQEHPDLHFTTHLNENLEEIRTVAELFPWSEHYLQTYDRFGLVGERSVFAHNVHPTEAELLRLAEARAAVAHCPSSNAFIGSGLFPMRQHLSHGVRFALGSDVGGGTGFSLIKEGLMAYLTQRHAPDGVRLTPTHLLYLATLAGAEALGLEGEIGSLAPGKAADVIWVRPEPGSTLEVHFRHLDSAEDLLGSLFTLHGEARVQKVWLDGQEAALS
ncbi:MAG: guanine deaminase [Meiothermus sp.]|uniref:guanine deaminase n=1 Tax=Meiothermus sp. TaxID=1955249 RepID=UPI0025F9E2D1|nr:guanine deaminase [Meiothermus sp.]MCS7059335.1 guanine deaminase [Meiothermus sp.]MCS7194327.1 guanine deaminase [Meiothermus sp.]MCX7740752.1 guanine deaminase [Meiothermus sp.]MDW8090504.1 guanine deaminase [Meiothermus sp.]MDW8482155.1 guanine deaminase [Meiothermus sp.]